MALHMLKRSAGNMVAATVTFVAVCSLVIGCQRTSNPATAPETDSETKKSSKVAPPSLPASSVLQSGDPGTVPAKELTGMLKGVPDAMRRNQTEVQLARDLGIRAWAVDFTGGPIICWLEIEETGQHTIDPRPYGGPKEIFFMGTDGAQGQILWWFRPGAHGTNPSARSHRIMQRLGKSAEAISEIMAISGTGLSGGYDETLTPPVPRLWSSWNDVAIKELNRTSTVASRGETTLLAIDATEKEPPEGRESRKVKLMLKAKANAPKP
jgi:hypothetical protein